MFSQLGGVCIRCDSPCMFSSYADRSLWPSCPTVVTSYSIPPKKTIFLLNPLSINTWQWLQVLEVLSAPLIGNMRDTLVYQQSKAFLDWLTMSSQTWGEMWQGLGLEWNKKLPLYFDSKPFQGKDEWPRYLRNTDWIPVSRLRRCCASGLKLWGQS